MRSLRARYVLAAAVLAAAALGPWDTALAQARGERQISSPITDRFALRGTFFSGDVTTDFRLDPSIGTLPGTLVSGEEDLGLDDKVDQGRVELVFRLRERNRVRVDYFKLRRYGENNISRVIVFGDDVFNVNDRVVSNLDYRQLTLTYTYSALRRERFELAGGLGVSLLEAEARGEVPARLLGEEASGVGAFPTIALEGTWRISRRFSVNLRGQYFTASVDEFDGSLADYHFDVQYRWRRNFTVGLGYTNLKTELEVQDEEFPGLFNVDTKGPELFFRVSF